MIRVRAKAPLRLGLAGGGTDVAPYSDEFGGMVLNATVSLYAFCTVASREDDQVSFEALDIEAVFTHAALPVLPVDHELALIAQSYNRIVADYCQGRGFACTIQTHADVPPGSGLGSSSTMVVAVITALAEFLRLPLGEYEIARLAFAVERQDLGLAGGKQDQYAATFGGFNLMEFYKDDRVIINPLRLRHSIVAELEAGLILYFSGRSRASAQIIDEQVRNVKTGAVKSIEAMHRLKGQARQMKEALLLGDFPAFGEVMRQGWNAKRDMASTISNDGIEAVLTTAIAAGAHGGKISGAGGGGFIIISVPPERKPAVLRALQSHDGFVFNCTFTSEGAQAWTVR